MTLAVGRLTRFAAAPPMIVAGAVALGAVTVLLGVGLMATAGYLISRAAEQPPILSLTVAIVGVRAFGLTRPVARYLDRLLSHDLALRALGQARVHAYERIEPLAPAGLEEYRDGDLLARMVADVDALQGLYLRGLGPPLVALAAGTAAVVVAALVLPAAGLVLACGLLAAATVVPLAAAGIGRAGSRRQARAGADLTADLVELMRGAPELVANGRAQDRFDGIRERDRRLVRLTRRAALADGLGNGLCLVVTGATVAGVVAVSAAAHDAGRLDRISIGMLGLLALASFEAVQPLPNAARELVATVAAGRRLLDLTDAEPAVTDPGDPAPLPSGPVTVALEGVSARYRRGERPVLVDAGLVLEPGRRVALVGPSGAGKTTVANLLIRFLDPERGRVTLAGRDLREYRQEDVRRVIAVAGQDAHMFSASILENVRLARPDAGDGEIETALRLAGALEWVRSLPEGWHTPVGEEGRELSGGQRQRVGVARALLTRAPVLVLDEPTAHLDRPTAEALVRDVLAAAGDRAVLLITHRAEGLAAMDEILELDAGTIRRADRGGRGGGRTPTRRPAGSPRTR
ncbi:MAG TPA: thiol reductant ABC exporter subunit CydC [Gaiellales bacterium]|nr:thiol reductant ABC exporter subunit CydC [Gaiellales bacterium]